MILRIWEFLISSVNTSVWYEHFGAAGATTVSVLATTGASAVIEQHG
jgi:hypothetical protein